MQVELEVQPSLEEQLETIKDVLHDFDVSEPLYVFEEALMHTFDFNPTDKLFEANYQLSSTSDSLNILWIVQLAKALEL